MKRSPASSASYSLARHPVSCTVPLRSTTLPAASYRPEQQETGIQSSSFASADLQLSKDLPVAVAPLQHSAHSCTAVNSSMLPTLYVPHGGGPLPILGSACHTAVSNFLRTVNKRIPEKPKAILVISAHWEEKQPQLMSSPDPGLLYDYYGFPPESYKITYPAPGDPGVAQQAADLLRVAGFQPELNPKRALDHGAFIPLKLMYPDADIPVVQLSLINSLDPEEHYAMGAALAPLRQEGVLLLGSGMSFHGMSTLMKGYGKAPVPGADPTTLPGQVFNQWLLRASQQEPAARQQLLADWSQAPGAGEAHPREEHLLPLMVVAGAASGQSTYGKAKGGSNHHGNSAAATGRKGSSSEADTAGHVLWDGECMGAAVSAVAFGVVKD